MMKGYGKIRSGVLEKTEYKLGGHRSFQYARLLERTRWSLPKSSMDVSRGNHPACGRPDARGIISDTLFRERKHSCEVFAAVSEETAGTTALYIQHYFFISV